MTIGFLFAINGSGSGFRCESSKESARVDSYVLWFIAVSMPLDLFVLTCVCIWSKPFFFIDWGFKYHWWRGPTGTSVPVPLNEKIRFQCCIKVTFLCFFYKTFQNILCFSETVVIPWNKLYFSSSEHNTSSKKMKWQQFLIIVICSPWYNLLLWRYTSNVFISQIWL